MSQTEYPAAMASEPTRRAGATLATQKVVLGEELPLFCEKCGYALHGLPQATCERCAIRHFHCPECGHHQPINTLRPAFQKILGRARALMTAWVVFLKINFFGWILFGWLAASYDFVYQYRYENTVTYNSAGYRTYNNSGPRYQPRVYPTEMFVGLGICGFAFGLVGRMLLLRWRAGSLVGLSMAALVAAMFLFGALWRMNVRRFDGVPNPSPFTPGFIGLTGMTAMWVVVGASIAWPVWYTMVHIFLPKRTGEALLEWQRAQSARAVGSLARE
jgi:hypothetical protein